MKSAITWFEIPTADFDRAMKFYSAILGAEVKVPEDMDMNMAMFPMDKDGEVGGALTPPDEKNAPSKIGTRVYLNCVGKLDEVISRVEPSGGKIVMPKTSIGEWGWIAMIEDTEGNVVGLHTTN